MTREQVKEAADRSWGQGGRPVDGGVEDRALSGPAAPEPRQTRMILVTLKRPVRLPICFLDAVREGGIEKISAFDEALQTQLGATDE